MCRVDRTGNALMAEKMRPSAGKSQPQFKPVFPPELKHAALDAEWFETKDEEIIDDSTLRKYYTKFMPETGKPETRPEDL